MDASELADPFKLAKWESTGNISNNTGIIGGKVVPNEIL